MGHLDKFYNGLRARVKNIMISLTADVHRNNAPHPHRPELRGSGIPRKRGKGKQ